MVIDEDRRYILTNYTQARNGCKAVDSDHATEYVDVDLKVVTENPERREIFKFKNKDAQERFKKYSSQTKQFFNCFRNDLPVLNQIEKWKEILKST